MNTLFSRRVLGAGEIMATYLLTWSPANSPWPRFEDEYETARERGYVDSRWSCGVTRRVRPGDRLFLLRQGLAPKGILAAGVAMSEPFQEKHWNDETKTAWYVAVRFEFLLRPETEILPRAALDKGQLRSVNWNTQASGMSIPTEAAADLKKFGQHTWIHWDDQFPGVQMRYCRGTSFGKAPCAV